MASLDETTLTRNLRPLQKSGWVTIRAGTDRREKLVAITEAGKTKVEQARPASPKCPRVHSVSSQPERGECIGIATGMHSQALWARNRSPRCGCATRL